MSAGVKRLLLIVLALLLGLVVFVWLRASASDTEVGAGAGTPESAPVAASRAVTHPEAGAPTSRLALPELASGPPASQPASQPDSAADDLATLRGRCISAETGQPLAGMRVDFRGYPRTGLTQSNGERRWAMPSPFVTGADGRFELRFPVFAWLVYRLEIDGAGRVAQVGSFPELSPRATTDLGDLACAHGFPVSGFVRDEAGTPVAEVQIFVSGNQPERRPDRPVSEAPRGMGSSGPDGGFVVAGSFPAGRWSLHVGSGHWGLVHLSPKSVEVVAGVGALGVGVVVQRRLSIEGTITEEDGTPVKELQLWAIPEGDGDGGAGGGGRAVDGKFQVFLVTGKPKPVQIRWEDDGKSEYEAFQTGTWFEWGARGVRLTAKRLASVELEVVEAGIGAPVEEFAVKRSRPTGETGGRRHGSLVYHGISPGGRRTLHGVPRGDLVLEVVPKRPDLLVSKPLRVVVSQAPLAPVRIELERATPFTVRVLQPDRAPVAGATVELIDCHARGRVMHDRKVDDERRAFSTEGSIRTFDHDLALSLVSAETTDAEGRARVFGSRLVPRLALRVLCPGHRPAISEDFALPAEDGEVEVFLSRGAGIDVTVKPVSIAGMRGVGFVLRRSADPLTLPLGSYPFAKDGTAQARGIPPGPWQVLFVHAERYLEPPLTVVEVKDGEVHRLELELPHLAPARLEGKIVWTGDPWQSGDVTLDARIDGRQVRQGAVLDGSGRFVADGLFPGRYQVSVSLRMGEMGEKTVRVALAELIELTAGVRLTRELDLIPRVLRLRLLDHDGKPAGGRSGTLDGESIQAQFVTDASGEARVTPVPGAEVRVSIDYDEIPGRFAIPVDREPELTVRLPAPEKR